MIVVPLINPLRFKKKDFTSNFQTKFFDESLYPETIRDFEEQASYRQPFQLNDPLILQVESDALSLSLVFYTCDGIPQYSKDFDQISSRTITSGSGTLILYLHQITVDLNNVGEGAFYAQIENDVILQSNNICIYATQPNTLLAKYRNYKFYQDVIFEKDTDLFFYLRVQGFIKTNLPERSSTTYEDQTLNVTQLKTVPFFSWKFITDSLGVPDYVIDLINRVFGCSTLYLDGRLFTVPDSEKFSELDEEYYPKRGWSIILREQQTNSSVAFGGTPDSSPVVAASGNILAEDTWNTTPGAVTISGTSVKYGFTISQIVKLLLGAREGEQQDIVVVSSPVGRQVKLNTSTHHFDVDPTIPFNPGETMTFLFEKN
jgi:hypothetical protein